MVTALGPVRHFNVPYRNVHRAARREGLGRAGGDEDQSGVSYTNEGNVVGGPTGVDGDSRLRPNSDLPAVGVAVADNVVPEPIPCRQVHIGQLEGGDGLGVGRRLPGADAQPGGRTYLGGRFVKYRVRSCLCHYIFPLCFFCSRFIFFFISSSSCIIWSIGIFRLTTLCFLCLISSFPSSSWNL